jgi:hypothetical protein
MYIPTAATDFHQLLPREALSPGAIAGLTLGAVALVCFFAFLTWAFGMYLG